MDAWPHDDVSAYERTPSPRWRGVLLSAALALVSVLVTLLLLEAALRVYHRAKRAYQEYALPPVSQRVAVPSADPELIFEFNPGWREDGFSVNAYGMADRPVTLEKPADVFRIAVLGDSISANHRLIPPGDTWLAKLRERLARIPGDRRIEVLNFAVNGYSLLQSARMLEARALRFAPDLVIVQLCLNDPYPSESAYTHLPSPSGSRLRDFLQLRLAPERYWAFNWVESRYDAEGIANLRRGFERIAAATQGGPPVLSVLFPYLYAPAYTDWHFERFHAFYRELAAAAGVTFLDLYDPFRDGGVIGMQPEHGDAVHPTAPASALAAASILDELARRALLPDGSTATRASTAFRAGSTSPRGTPRRGAPRTSPCLRSRCARSRRPSDAACLRRSR
jgi:lysophospholipase L1-like esterase